MGAASNATNDASGTTGKKPVDISDTKNVRACGGRMCAMFFPGKQLGGGKVRTPVAKAANRQERQAPPATARRRSEVGSSWSASTGTTTTQSEN